MPKLLGVCSLPSNLKKDSTCKDNVINMWRNLFGQRFFKNHMSYTLAKGDLTLSQASKFILAQIQSICRRQNNHYPKIKICVGVSRKHCQKRRIIMLINSIFSFPTVISKLFFALVVKSLDSTLKGLFIFIMHSTKLRHHMTFIPIISIVYYNLIASESKCTGSVFTNYS